MRLRPRPSFKTARGKIKFATEKELLVFANKVRQAGGADVLEALLPSIPKHSNQCLIAKALNFDCTVSPLHSVNGPWYMNLRRLENERREAIAQAVDCELRDGYRLMLPTIIANTARAFDRRAGWTAKYARATIKREKYVHNY